MREKYGIKENAFVVLHVGHAEAGRGLDVLSELQEIMSDIEIIIVLSSRNKIVKENPLNPKIKIIDRYLEDIHEIFATADVYLFPIKTKGSAIDIPLSIIEAKNMNLPVIASDVGFVKETIKGYSKGYLIEVNSPKEMAKNIKHILEEKIIKKSRFIRSKKKRKSL
jgi:glycosyltransferase involved in cell wall biosynthesis